MRELTGYLCLIAGILAAGEVSEQKKLWIESFDVAWKTIAAEHFDAKLGGVDWDKAKRELRPKVEGAENETAARGAIGEMIARLGHSHVSLIPREAYPEVGKAKGSAETGIELRRIGGEFLVTRVASSSAAAKAGVKTGWTLKAVDGQPLEKFQKANDLYATRAALSLMRGEEGSEVKLAFAEVAEVLVRREKPPGKMTTFGNLPPMPLEIEFRLLPGGIGYLRITAFFDPEWLEAEMRKGIAACRQCKGFVVDVRGNPGGLGVMSSSLTGWFVNKQVELGRIEYRHMKLNMVAAPRAESFLGKLALLTDGLSYSTSEVLAGGWKDLKRARLFGEKTGGGALPSGVIRLPSGDALQYVFANYISAGGQAPEGVGVAPDEQVRPTKAELLAGRDSVLEAATKWIEKGN